MPNILTTVKKWDEIKDAAHWDSLLFGNGASIAISDKFSYASLLGLASQKRYISEEVKSLFTFLRTHDFEYVLGILFNANVVNQTLKIKDQTTAKAYYSLRDALIKTIIDTHVEWNEAKDRFSKLADYLKRFKIVVSLNYDLVVYWTMLVGNDKFGPNLFKDCFIKGKFCTDWRRLVPPFGDARSSTLVFYPHGNLSLVRDIYGIEKKIQASGASLLKKVFNEWTTTNHTPLFVAEGTSNQKLGAIYRSEYLRQVFEDVLPNIGSNLVIYGWSVGANDLHILKAIARRSEAITSIALSVHSSDTNATVTKKVEILKVYFQTATIYLFDSESQ